MEKHYDLSVWGWLTIGMMIGLILGLFIATIITINDANKAIEAQANYYIWQCRLKESGIVSLHNGFEINISIIGD